MFGREAEGDFFGLLQRFVDGGSFTPLNYDFS
jgi:hypothetical protein